jgi:hypothetical protein
MKYILKKRLGGQRFLLVLASRPERPRSSRTARSVVAGMVVLDTLRRLGRGSGLAPGEATDALPGDEIVTDPMWQSTRAITIKAPPEQVWPWIVQMGFPSHRAGWYTPHWLDRITFGIRQRSADHIRSELQQLTTGERVPDSDDFSTFFTVEAVDPPHALVLHSTRHVLKPIRTINFSWAFAIREITPGRSRLFIRARTNYTPRWAAPFVELVVGSADFVNAGAMLRGIKKRVESTTARRPLPAGTRDPGHLADAGEPRLEEPEQAIAATTRQQSAAKEVAK